MPPTHDRHLRRVEIGPTATRRRRSCQSLALSCRAPRARSTDRSHGNMGRDGTSPRCPAPMRIKVFIIRSTPLTKVEACAARGTHRAHVREEKPQLCTPGGSLRASSTGHCVMFYLACVAHTREVGTRLDSRFGCIFILCAATWKRCLAHWPPGVRAVSVRCTHPRCTSGVLLGPRRWSWGSIRRQPTRCVLR